MTKKTDTGAFDMMGTSGVTASADANSMTFDLSAVETPSMEVLPKGDYQVLVESCEFTESAKGNPMLSFTYVVTEGEFTGRKLFDYVVLTGKGAEYSLPKLKQLIETGCPEVSLVGFNPVTFAEEGIAINRIVTASVSLQKQKSGDYKGELQNRIRGFKEKAASGSFM